MIGLLTLLTPSRLAHRLRDMQSLPYAVVTNPHMSYVYESYFNAFEAFRKAKPVKTVEDNDEYCSLVRTLLEEHLTIIPRLAIGVLECRDLMPAEEIDRLMYTLLRSVRLFLLFLPKADLDREFLAAS